MPRIRCLYLDCLFRDDRYCSAASIEIDPDIGCATYTPMGGETPDNWDDEEILDDWDIEILDDDEKNEAWLDEI